MARRWPTPQTKLVELLAASDRDNGSAVAVAIGNDRYGFDHLQPQTGGAQPSDLQQTKQD